jgi:hypothetical protein
VIGRCLVVAGLGVAVGLLGLLRSTLQPHGLSEELLEQSLPYEIDGMPMTADPEHPQQSYKMDEAVYRQLQPTGIVARIYEDATRSFDAVVIEGTVADSFHDQRACFTAQDWSITSEETIQLEIPGQEDASAMIIEVAGPIQNSIAIYAFSGPSGHVTSSFNSMWRDFIWSEVTTGKVLPGRFYRFIALHSGATKTEIRVFAEEFLVACMQLASDKPGVNGDEN